MVKKLLIKFIFCLSITFSNLVYANPNIDQWLDSEKTYKDLINEGYEVKSYSISNIQTAKWFNATPFVTVLQRILRSMSVKNIKQWTKFGNT